MKYKAFLFDMDGVIVDSETTWDIYEEEFYNKLFGEEINKKIGDTLGVTIDVIYEKAARHGFTMEKEIYLDLFTKQAMFIYELAQITNGMVDTVKILKEMGFKLGIVSASREIGIDAVLKKAGLLNEFSTIVSLDSRKDLRSKPAPDGYIEAMKILKIKPSETIVLEDSNAGIAAGKASGAFTIGFSGNLVTGYKQEGADIYANTMPEVIKIVKKVI